jgi:hypothetical protein
MGAVELRRDLVFLRAAGEDLSCEYFRIVLRPIADKLYVCIVPTAAQVVGNTVDGHKVIVRVVDATPYELHHVAVTDPREQLPCVDWPIRRTEGANAKTRNTYTESH